MRVKRELGRRVGAALTAGPSQTKPHPRPLSARGEGRRACVQVFAIGKAQGGVGGCGVISEPVKEETRRQNQNKRQTLEGRSYETTGQISGQMAHEGLVWRAARPYGSLHRRPGARIWGERMVDRMDAKRMRPSPLPKETSPPNPLSMPVRPETSWAIWRGGEPPAARLCSPTVEQGTGWGGVEA